MPGWFFDFVRVAFGERNASFWATCAVQGKVTPHAVWELACDKVVNGRVILLGDAAHMASPQTGSGARMAMADSWDLKRAMETATSIEEALAKYNQDTVARGNALYHRSRQAAVWNAPPQLAPHAHPRDLIARVASFTSTYE